jgi:hypothetical protein
MVPVDEMAEIDRARAETRSLLPVNNRGDTWIPPHGKEAFGVMLLSRTGREQDEGRT